MDPIRKLYEATYSSPEFAGIEGYHMPVVYEECRQVVKRPPV
jgi:hypothetical protein